MWKCETWIVNTVIAPANQCIMQFVNILLAKCQLMMTRVNKGNEASPPPPHDNAKLWVWISHSAIPSLKLFSRIFLYCWELFMHFPHPFIASLGGRLLKVYFILFYFFFYSLSKRHRNMRRDRVCDGPSHFPWERESTLRKLRRTKSSDHDVGV